MGIRFSPGPCGCCKQTYVAVAVPYNNFNQFNYDALTVGSVEGNFSVSGPVSHTRPYSLIASNSDLAKDAAGVTPATFNPIPSILPLPNPQVGVYGNADIFVPGVLGMTVGPQGSAFDLIQIYQYQISLFQVTGSQGAWSIRSSQTKIILSNSYTLPATGTFTINPDGSVGL